MFLTSWAELEVPLEAAVRDGDVFLADDREAKKAWCVDRQELLLCLTSQLLQDKHTWTHRPALQETLLLTKSILGLPGWIRAGYRGVGDIRPACLFPSVKSKCFLDYGVWCCKVGHSCMGRVIACSVPHKMAWRSVARAVRTAARLGGPGCEFFDVSQLTFELDRKFQELDTPPSRCCWRCGCALSGVSLISADVDQAFEACSSSAVLPAWRRISQTMNPGSHQILSWFVGVVVSCANRGVRSHLVVDGHRLPLRSWSGHCSVSRPFHWPCWAPWYGKSGAFELVVS